MCGIVTTFISGLKYIFFIQFSSSLFDDDFFPIYNINTLLCRLFIQLSAIKCIESFRFHSFILDAFYSCCFVVESDKCRSLAI